MSNFQFIYYIETANYSRFYTVKLRKVNCLKRLRLNPFFINSFDWFQIRIEKLFTKKLNYDFFLLTLLKG